MLAQFHIKVTSHNTVRTPCIKKLYKVVYIAKVKFVHLFIFLCFCKKFFKRNYILMLKYNPFSNILLYFLLLLIKLQLFTCYPEETTPKKVLMVERQTGELPRLCPASRPPQMGQAQYLYNIVDGFSLHEGMNVKQITETCSYFKYTIPQSLR